jgi:hypothetical protein
VLDCVFRVPATASDDQGIRPEQVRHIYLSMVSERVADVLALKVASP